MEHTAREALDAWGADVAEAVITQTHDCNVRISSVRHPGSQRVEGDALTRRPHWTTSATG